MTLIKASDKQFQAKNRGAVSVGSSRENLTILLGLSSELIVTQCNQTAADFFRESPRILIGQDFPQLCEQHHFRSPITPALARQLQHQPTNSITVDGWDITPLAGSLDSITTFTLSKNIAPQNSLSAKSVLDNAPCGICWKDRNGVVLGGNFYFSDMAGFECTEDLVGKTDADFPWTQDQTAQIRKCDRTVLQTEKTHQYEQSVRLASGEIKSFISIKSPLWDENQNVVGILTVDTEINAGSDTDLGLLQTLSNALMGVPGYLDAPPGMFIKLLPDFITDIVETIPCQVYWKDRHSTYLGCNQQTLDMLGYQSPIDIIGKTDFDIAKHLGLSRATAESIRENDQQIMETQTTVSHGINLFENLYPDKKSLSIKIPLRDHNRHVIGILCFTRPFPDSPAFNQAIATSNPLVETILRGILSQGVMDSQDEEAQLAATQGFLSILTQHIPGIIYWKDLDSVYLGCNDAAFEFVGIPSREDFVGKTDHDFAKQLGWDKNIAKKSREDDLAVIQTGITKTTEETLKSYDGKEVILQTNKTPWRDSAGKIIGVVGVAIDVSERRQYANELVTSKERAEDANKAKSAFLATMSHELRTPLNAIMGMSQILQSHTLNKEQAKLVEVILQSGNSLLGLINDILDFAKLEAGKLKITHSTFDLNQLVNDTINSMLHLIEDTSVKLLLEYDIAIPRHIIGDENRLRQILVNLIGNAIKFTAEGNIKVVVDCVEKNNKCAKLRITVSDTGIGIPEDKLTQIFQRFTQVESRYGRKYEGTGLGLTISRQLVEAMGGNITAESTLGKGSSFCINIDFPLPSVSRRNTKHESQSSGANIETAEDEQRQNRILLVEDNKLNQLVAVHMLEGLGCHLDVVENGQEALEKIDHNHYDLVFMDIGLPDMSGLEVTQAIRKHPECKSVPVVALTAHVLEQDKDNCFSAGANDILTKPVMQNELQAMIQKWINKKKPA